MDKLRCMEAFVAVVETGNFSAAADKLDVSSVMVGKHIRQLEELLGARLLQRSTRRQSLTEAGAAFYESARTVLEQVRVAEHSIETMQATPRGLLRVSAPVTLGACAVAPLISGYLRQHAEVKVELVLSNTRVDLIEEGFDMAIRIGALAASELVARPLRPYRMIICAAPAYLERAGVPRTSADLANHQCLAHLVWNGRTAWQLEDKPEYAWPRETRFASNDGQALRAAAVNGAGLILQPEVLLADDLAAGRLVPLLQSHVPVARPVNLVYFRDRRPRRKLMSLVEYLLERMGEPANA
ncbi:LysR substrate-binding domain-containing protein [Caballeronia mineralivorans]|jgi:DNA-binding transcriptional LysR family regulator|uniref:LysR substrate-binding domain-containing protein n=1 Tax=Caballeronia mineralivorans TaxID=2010198 RepID=UPI0023F3570E|nr:LysR substrate-binding domain-containing protein [Caballeronia mineralivorans]MDB5785324.1 transcriptional regulator [Caballeronia mineralivorans]MEA3102264.1 hypothetical protein [Caballeronia mineralivorans]